MSVKSTLIEGKVLPIGEAIRSAFNVCEQALTPGSKNVAVPEGGELYVVGFPEGLKIKVKTESDVPEQVRIFARGQGRRGEPSVYVQFVSASARAWAIPVSGSWTCNVIVTGLKSAFSVNRELIDRLTSSNGWADLRPVAMPQRPMWDTILYKKVPQPDDAAFGIRAKIRALDDTWQTTSGAKFPDDYIFLQADFVAGTLSIPAAASNSDQQQTTVH